MREMFGGAPVAAQARALRGLGVFVAAWSLVGLSACDEQPKSSEVEKKAAAAPVPTAVPPAPEPYVGQFIQLDVQSVETAQP